MDSIKKGTVIEFIMMIVAFGVLQLVVHGRPEEQIEWLNFATSCLVFTIGLIVVALFMHKVKEKRAS